MIRTTLLATVLLVAATPFADMAHAAAGPRTPMEQAELSQLSPKLRSEVEARLSGGQTVRGVLETMVLNQVSSDFATGKVVASDFARGEIVVENRTGQTKVIPFDVTTLAVHN